MIHICSLELWLFICLACSFVMYVYAVLKRQTQILSYPNPIPFNSFMLQLQMFNHVPLHSTVILSTDSSKNTCMQIL